MSSLSNPEPHPDSPNSDSRESDFSSDATGNDARNDSELSEVFSRLSSFHFGGDSTKEVCFRTRDSKGYVAVNILLFQSVFRFRFRFFIYLLASFFRPAFFFPDLPTLTSYSV